MARYPTPLQNASLRQNERRGAHCRQNAAARVMCANPLHELLARQKPLDALHAARQDDRIERALQLKRFVAQRMRNGQFHTMRSRNARARQRRTNANVYARTTHDVDNCYRFDFFKSVMQND